MFHVKLSNICKLITKRKHEQDSAIFEKFNKIMPFPFRLLTKNIMSKSNRNLSVNNHFFYLCKNKFTKFKIQIFAQYIFFKFEIFGL